jgi:uncharacterized membrane protein (DUF485 family)
MACALAALTAIAWIAIILEWLVVIAQLEWVTTPTGNLLAGAIVFSVAVSLMTWLAGTIRSRYWQRIHDSLAAAIPASGPQRGTFNLHHDLLLEASSTQRRDALNRILGYAPPPIVMGKGGTGDQDE